MRLLPRKFPLPRIYWMNPDVPEIDEEEPLPIGLGTEFLIEELRRPFRALPTEKDDEHSW